MKTALQSLQRLAQADAGLGNAAPLVAMANKQVNKLISIVNDLLDVEKVQSGKLRLNKTKYILGESAKEVIGHMELQEPGYCFMINDLSDDTIEADKIRIESVLTNLLTNAVKFSPAKGSIHIFIEKERAFVKCSVKDQGIGIPDDLQPYVFERFFRVHASSQWFSGLGLGLYISAEIIKKHGGSIGLESKEGRGSTFWFTLPIANL